ncbi:MAG: chlorite dismutase family protein [Armatimonadetes bacterium]|nr:chlorite dismutase family protein [Armatimonadota bacterium]
MSDVRFHGFLFYQVTSGHRTVEEAARVRNAIAAAERTPGIAGIAAYSLVGLRAGLDLGLWIAGTSIDAFMAGARCLHSTNLVLKDALWGYVRPSQYTGRDGTSVKVPGTRLRYLVVYPFIKTHAWYQLTPEVRRGMMTSHAKVGHNYEGIEQLLLYSTGLNDAEFVVGYEMDDLERFSQLVTDLRATAARPYTERDTPMYTGKYGPVAAIVDEVFGA